MTRSINYETAQEIASIRAEIANFTADYAGVLLHTSVARAEYESLWARLRELTQAA